MKYSKHNNYTKVTRSKFLFLVYYCLFFISLFVVNVNIDPIIAASIAKIFKIIVMLALLIHSLFFSWKKSLIYRLIICILIGLLFLITSGDFYWVLVLLMGVVASKIEENYIFKLSFILISILTILTFFFYCIGFLPDNLTSRTDFSDTVRHSFGFLYSNVLPNCIFYILIFYLTLKKNKAKFSFVLGCTLLSIFVYNFCESRNALVGVVLLVISFYICKSNIINLNKGRILRVGAKWSFFVCCFASIIPSYLRSLSIGLPIWYKLDRIVTNRTLIGSTAIEAYGIHFFNRMTSEEYTSRSIMVDSYKWNGVILDSGYLYILIRYGICALLFFALIYYSILKAYKMDYFMCSLLILLSIINMIDNNFLSYGFLPFVLIGIRNLWIQRGKRKLIIKI